MITVLYTPIDNIKNDVVLCETDVCIQDMPYGNKLNTYKGICEVGLLEDGDIFYMNNVKNIILNKYEI